MKKIQDIMKKTKAGSSFKRASKPDLWETALGGTVAEVKQLVQSGAKLNKRTNDGFTALMLATGRGDPKITGYLIEQGADVNARNEIGQTALMIAALRGHKGIVKQLLAAGADLHAEDNEKRNAISWATSQQDLPEIVAMLGCAGINYDALD